MFIEKDIAMAIAAWAEGKEVIVLDLEEGQNVTMDEFMGNTKWVHFLVNEPDPVADPEELHTDEEFEELFEEVPEVALEETPEPKLSRAEKRHMIEGLITHHPEMSVKEIAERVGVSVQTVKRHIK